MAWLLLALHQLCFEDITIAQPHLCGYADVASQMIRQALNADLRRISSLAADGDLDSRQLEYLKVIALLYLFANSR